MAWEDGKGYCMRVLLASGLFLCSLCQTRHQSLLPAHPLNAHSNNLISNCLFLLITSRLLWIPCNPPLHPYRSSILNFLLLLTQPHPTS